jgi:hypothetical protein
MNEAERDSSEIEVSSVIASGATASNEALLPAGLAMPKPLKIEGNLATNWKRFNKRNWDN